MFRKINIRETLLTGLIAAVLFCIPVTFYINSASYHSTWLLYMGSFLFLIVIWIHTMKHNNSRKENETAMEMVFASLMTTIAGILLACFFCFILLSFLIPGYLGSGTPGKVLTDEPTNTVSDKTNGLSIDVFMAATIINFSVGSFAGIVLFFYTKRRPARIDPIEANKKELSRINAAMRK